MKGHGFPLLRRLRDSFHLKALLMLFFVMCAACVVTYLIIFFVVHREAYTLSSQILQDRASALVEMYHRSDFSLEELVEEYRRSVGEIDLVRDFSYLPPLRGVIVPDDMQEETMYLCARRDIPYGALRIGNEYVLLSPFLFGWETTIIRNIVLHTLLLCALLASVSTVLVLNRSFRPLHELDDAIKRVAGGDFTARVHISSTDEMGKIGRNFNWMTEELGRIEYLRRDFVSSVSHEFKTPLAAVQGSARMLATLPPEKLTKERLDKYTALILEQTNRMSTLASNLLRLSRLEQQTCAEEICVFPLDEQLRRAILTLENQWSAKKLQPEIQLEEVTYRGDLGLLYQVWMNLLSNAIKFSHTGGVLEVIMTQQREAIEVKIRDYGEGMTPETLRRLFEKFYQGDGSRKTEGSGLGLSIVKRILDLHHGEISFESTLGEGTLCTVLLPRPEIGQQQDCGESETPEMRKPHA